MKYSIIIFFWVGFSLPIYAQTDTSDYYKAFLHVPAFNLNKAPDSTTYNNKNLTANQPLVMLFFSPDCDHCQKEATELFQHKEAIKDIPLLMISISSLKEINDFISNYRLNELHNVTVVQDDNFRLGNIFKMKTFPAMYIYDNHQALLKAFIGNGAVQKMIDLFAIGK